MLNFGFVSRQINPSQNMFILKNFSFLMLLNMLADKILPRGINFIRDHHLEWLIMLDFLWNA